MFEVWINALLSVALVSLLSFVGILPLSIKEERLRKILIYFISFSAGALFGDVFIHLLPEAVAEGFSLETSIFIISGIIVSFIVEKVVHWRHCHMPITKSHIHPFAIMNLIGDSVHNFIDGLIIGGSYLVSSLIGVTSTVAVVLHEIPQEIGDFGVLLHGGFTRRRALFFNFVTALTAVAGAITALIISSFTGDITRFLIPFAAGGFIYIAGSDLIPELHKEWRLKESFFQVLTFILGVEIMSLLLFIE